ncbi:histidine phosphatase family protein [Candidatus Woesearchaeota archaeon]|nr:histidine phosphatase family protein [Candidatus Woesearchaeota archaeon]
MVKELYIARHGETVENVAKIVQGNLDGTLSPHGIRQAQELGMDLKDEGIEFILCGDLGRQKQTAAEIRKYVPVPIEYTLLLRERGGGDLEGKTYQNLGIVEEADFERYCKEGVGIFKSVEQLESVNQRAQHVVGRVLKLPQRKIITVGSGWINSCMVNILLGEPFVYHHQENGTVHYFKFDDRGKPIIHELDKKNF